MIKMQDKILSEIDGVAKDYELELVVSYAANNTGRLYIMDGLTLICSYTFDFQSSYFSLHIYHAVVEPGTTGQHIKEGSRLHLKYHETHELKKMLDFLDDYLREYDIEKAGEED